MLKTFCLFLPLFFGQYCYQDAQEPDVLIECPEGYTINADCKAAAIQSYMDSMNLLIDLACIAQSDVYAEYWPEMDAHAQAYQDCVAANQGQIHQVDCMSLYIADVNDTNQWLADEIAEIDADFAEHSEAILNQLAQDLSNCCQER